MEVQLVVDSDLQGTILPATRAIELLFYVGERKRERRIDRFALGAEGKQMIARRPPLSRSFVRDRRRCDRDRAWRNLAELAVKPSSRAFLLAGPAGLNDVAESV